MSEQYGFALVLLGVLLIGAGALWLIVRAFRERVLWGLAVLLLPVVGVVAFVVRHARKARGPLAVALAGGLVLGGTFAANEYLSHHLDLGPREKRVDGELHLTLTGWDQTDYAILEAKPDAVVLQMANADVTDATLEHLRGMSGLRELDLNDTQVTGDGLRVLAELPLLQILRLRKTKVTDEDFREHLGPRESLRELDLRETQVSGKTLREWKAKRPDERRYLR